MDGTIRRVVLWLLLTCSECLAIDVRIGQAVTLSLPGYLECGQYALLGPSITPVVIIAGENASKVIGQYVDRVLVDQTDPGFNMTLYDVTKADGGKYKVVASSSNAKRPCGDAIYDVVVKAASDEFLMEWGQWTPCKAQCDPRENRFRQRNCSISGGCQKMGATMETETCEKAPQCAHWTTWGSWGECSAKCGKGFKIRKRACLKSSSAFVERSACEGPSTESHMCMTVCEFIGIWSGWTDWSACTLTCGGEGSRSRSRECLKDQRVTVDCAGNNTDTETCGNDPCGVTIRTIRTTLPPIPIPETKKTTPTQDKPGHKTTTNTPETSTKASDTSKGSQDKSRADEDENESLNLFVIIGIACLLAMCIIIVLIIVLRKRAERRKHNDATMADMRPKDQMTARRQKRSREEEKKKTDDKIAKGNSVNVYSEMSSNSNSNVGWNSADFDMDGALGDIAENDAEAENAENEGKTTENSCDNSSVSLVFDDSEFDDESNNETVDGKGDIAEGEDNVYCHPPEVECVTGVDKKVYTKVNHVSYTPSNYDDDIEHIYEPSPDEKPTITLEEVPVSDKLGSVSYSKVNRDSKKKQNTIDVNDVNDDNVYENCEVYTRDCKKISIKGKSNKETESKLLSADDHKVLLPPKSPKPKTSVDQSNRDLPPPPYGDVNSLKNTKLQSNSDHSLKGSRDKKKWNNLDNEHTYANEKVSADTEHFYVTPKMIGKQHHQQQQQQQQDQQPESEEHIYDTPKPF